MQGPLSPYESLAPRRTSRRVVLIAHSSLQAELSLWLEQFAADQCYVFSTDSVAPAGELAGVAVAPSCAEISDSLLWLGRVDVLVNLLTPELLPADAPTHQDTWWQLHFHLAAGGLYVVRRLAAPGPELADTLDAFVTAVIRGDAGKSPNDEAELIVPTNAPASSRELVVIRKRATHYAKLRDAETDELLPLREPGIRIIELASEPAGTLRSRARITSHEAAVEIRRLPKTFSYPELHLRHYQGKIAFAGRTLLFGQRSILPDSFRHHLRASPVNRHLVDVTPRFARVPNELQPKETLPGNYYQLDSSFPGHFGHLTTEVLSRFWGWDHAKQQIPDLKVLLHLHPKQDEPALERRYFEAYGVPAKDIVWTDKPVFVESLVCATPMWHNAVPHYAHPGITAVWDRLAASLIDRSGPSYERIFVSRRDQQGRRICHNKDEVEELFAGYGFEVVYPEELDLGRQAALFADAKVIAGFGGSAMFNLMFAQNVTTTILLNHEAYTARNEHLFTSLIGGDVHYFWSTPEIPHPPGGWTTRAFKSDWTFDFERNRAPLDALIATL